MANPYRIVPWDQQAGREDFFCSKPEIDKYWRSTAVRHARERLAAVTVMVETATERVVGFYTMVNYTLIVETLPESLNPKKLPRNLPTTLIGKLAVHADYQRRGLGSILLSHAIETAVRVSAQVASYAMVVDAIDADAVAFYQRFGFRPLTGDPMRLMLTMADAQANMAFPAPDCAG